MPVMSDTSTHVRAPFALCGAVKDSGFQQQFQQPSQQHVQQPLLQPLQFVVRTHPKLAQ